LFAFRGNRFRAGARFNPVEARAMMFAVVISWILALTVLALGLSLLLFKAITGNPSVSAGRAEADDIVALLRQAGLPSRATISELGCGWGKIVIALAKEFPDARIIGIERSPFPYWIACLAPAISPTSASTAETSTISTCATPKPSRVIS
jgi:hypothetical protein